jgi:hypothetical protein
MSRVSGLGRGTARSDATTSSGCTDASPPRRRVARVAERHRQRGGDVGGVGAHEQPVGARHRAARGGDGADAVVLGAEQPRRRGVRAAVQVGQHLAEDPGELLGHVGGVVEALLGVGVGGAAQEPVVGGVAGEHRFVGGVGQAVRVVADEAEPEAEHGQRPADRVQVGADGGAGAAQLALGHPVARRGVDGVDQVVHAAHAAQVDELDLLLALDDVVGLEVAVQQALAVQVAERAQHLQAVGDDLVHRQPLVARAVAAALDDEVAQRLAADVLHDDVPGGHPGAGVGVLHEVVDADDVGVLDLGEERALGRRRLLRLRVAAVQQALEHHPAFAHVVVARQVDPAQAAVGQAAQDLVLAGDEVALLQLGQERVRGAARGAHALDRAGAADRPAPHPAAAGAAEAVLLGDHRVGHDRGGGVAVGDLRHLHHAEAEHAARRGRGAAADPPRGAAADAPAQRAGGAAAVARRSGGGVAVARRGRAGRAPVEPGQAEAGEAESGQAEARQARGRRHPVPLGRHRHPVAEGVGGQEGARRRSVVVGRAGRAAGVPLAVRRAGHPQGPGGGHAADAALAVAERAGAGGVGARAHRAAPPAVPGLPGREVSSTAPTSPCGRPARGGSAEVAAS